MPVTTGKIGYAGWRNCYRLSDGRVEVIATADVGPRLIRFGFVGGHNEFAEYAEMLGQMGGDEWRIYGGHRFWHAPEAMPRTYAPDNAPVEVEAWPDGLRLIQPVEVSTGIQKEIEVRLGGSPEAAQVQLTHRLRNRGAWPVELAPWALSAMAPGGTAIIPLPPRGKHPEDLVPTTLLAIWPYSNMADPRWTWGRKYVLLRGDPAGPDPQKVGALDSEGWMAYARAGHLFVKTFATVLGARYPDLGCSAEVFTNTAMLELETLGPLASLAPGAAVEHAEHWYLFDEVMAPNNDAEVEEHVRPHIERIRRTTEGGGWGTSGAGA